MAKKTTKKPNLNLRPTTDTNLLTRALLERAAASVAAVPDGQLIKQLSDAETGRQTALDGWDEAIALWQADRASYETSRDAFYRAHLDQLRAIAGIICRAQEMLQEGDADAAHAQLVQLKKDVHEMADVYAEALPGVWQQIAEGVESAEGANQNG